MSAYKHEDTMGKISSAVLTPIPSESKICIAVEWVRVYANLDLGEGQK